MEGVKNFTNIDNVDFEGVYGGEKRVIKKGKTVPLPETLANHFANQLATKILIREEKDYLSDPKRPVLLRQIIGEVVVPGERTSTNLQKPPEKEPEKEEKQADAAKEKKKDGEFEDLPPQKPPEKEPGKETLGEKVKKKIRGKGKK